MSNQRKQRDRANKNIKTNHEKDDLSLIFASHQSNTLYSQKANLRMFPKKTEISIYLFRISTAVPTTITLLSLFSPPQKKSEVLVQIMKKTNPLIHKIAVFSSFFFHFLDETGKLGWLILFANKGVKNHQSSKL